MINNFSKNSQKSNAIPLIQVSYRTEKHIPFFNFLIFLKDQNKTKYSWLRVTATYVKLMEKVDNNQALIDGKSF